MDTIGLFRDHDPHASPDLCPWRTPGVLNPLLGVAATGSAQSVSPTNRQYTATFKEVPFQLGWTASGNVDFDLASGAVLASSVVLSPPPASGLGAVPLEFAAAHAVGDLMNENLSAYRPFGANPPAIEELNHVQMNLYTAAFFNVCAW